MLQERLMETLRWLRADMRNACIMVYSCLDNNEAVINEVLRQIAAPVDAFAAIILAEKPLNRCQKGETK